MTPQNTEAITLPPQLLKEIERLAKRNKQTTGEVVQAALREFMAEERIRERCWKATRAYGTTQAKRLGIRTEEDVQAIMDELRYGRPQRHASSRRR